MRGNGDVGRVADDFVRHAPFAVGGVAPGEVQRAGDDADAGIALGQTAAEVLKVRPVVAVETLADLGAHVREEEGVVHGFLAPFCVGCGDLVAAVVAGTQVVLKAGTELLRDGRVLNED